MEFILKKSDKGFTVDDLVERIVSKDMDIYTAADEILSRIKE